MIIMLFSQSYAIQPAPLNKPCISLRVFLFLSCRVSLAEYIRVLRVYPTMLQVKSSACWRWWLTASGLDDSTFIFIYMLLSEEVTYASIVFGTYINVIIWKLCCFPLTGFETQTCTIICESICNIIFRCNPAYVMCICLITRSWLWC